MPQRQPFRVEGIGSAEPQTPELTAAAGGGRKERVTRAPVEEAELAVRTACNPGRVELVTTNGGLQWRKAGPGVDVEGVGQKN